MGCDAAKRQAQKNFKLLYDIYSHANHGGWQMLLPPSGKYSKYIAHYHTGGVPGRHEINETQELFYPAIMKVILQTGYTGFVAQEFIPSWPDKIAALKQGVGNL